MKLFSLQKRTETVIWAFTTRGQKKKKKKEETISDMLSLSLAYINGK